MNDCGRGVRVRDRDERGEVEDDLDALGRGRRRSARRGCRRAGRPGPPRVARSRLVEPAGRAARVVQAERADVGAFRRPGAPSRWLPMNPSAPGDEDLRAAQGHVATPRAAASCSRWPTSIHSSSISNAPTGSPAASRSAMRSGVSTPSTRADPGHDRRVERVDPAVDLALEGGLLLEPGHAIAVALDAAERHRVEVAPCTDRRAIARRPRARRAARPGPPR